MPQSLSYQTIPLPLHVGGYAGDSSPLASFRCVNLYPEKIKGETENDLILVGTPGTTLLKSLSANTHRVGGAATHTTSAYFVIGSSVFKYNTDGTSSVVGTLNTAGGAVSMSSNGTEGLQLTIVDGADGWIWNGTTFTQITDAQFPASPTKVEFIDGYTVVLEEDSDTFYLSDFYNSNSYTGTQSARAERNPDGLLNLAANNRQLWLFGVNTTEIWYNSGNAFPFDPLPNGFLQWGIFAANSLANLDAHGLIWIAQDRKGKGQVLHAAGHDVREICPPEILSIWRTYSSIEDAFAFSYQENGHVFYVLTFPTANRTWVYDLSTERWHERTFDGSNRVIANSYTYFNNKHIVGDYGSGSIYDLTLDEYDDDGEAIEREFITYHISSKGEKVRHVNLEVELETGVGLLSGQGSDPQIWMSFSDDGGRTFGNKRYQDIGAAGAYNTRISWPMLGSSRNRVYKFGISDPVKVRISRILLTVSGTSH